jgi:hypothetical protein
MWPDTVQEVLDGDLAVALAYVTPAKGVVVTPVTNFGGHDRVAGTVHMNTSVGMPAKLERMRANPHVALVWHTRTHGDSTRPEYVLVQGTASLSDPIADQPQRMREMWERRTGPIETGLVGRWLRIYYLRVEVTIAVERVVVWPSLDCLGEATVYGEPLPGDPPAQKPPKGGVGPRLDVDKAVGKAAKLPHVLAGWVGADGFPFVVPVSIGPGFELSSPVPLPVGGRRAGICAHWFTPQVLSQRQQRHTGWLDGSAYAPHTQHGYAMPGSRLVYNAAVGFETRRRHRLASRG